MKDLVEYTQDEKIELLKSNLTQIIAEINLPLSITYYVFGAYMNQLKDLYDKYSNNVQQSIFQKMEINEHVASFNEVEQELKNNNPNFQVFYKEGCNND